MDGFEKQVAISGIGWVFSGLLCLVVYAHQVQQADPNLSILLVGILAACVGSWVSLSRKKIIKLKKKLEKRR